MKTTVVVDERKLKNVMKSFQLKTIRQAIDFALEQAEKMAKARHVFEGDFFVTKSAVIDSKYDLKKTRELDKPKK